MDWGTLRQKSSLAQALTTTRKNMSLFRAPGYSQLVTGFWLDHARNNPIIRLLKSSTIEDRMATVNFSVPDDVKVAFDRAFGDQNKSAIIADLMRKAVAEATRRKQREAIFRQLTQRRARRPSLSSEELRVARMAGRP